MNQRLEKAYPLALGVGAAAIYLIVPSLNSYVFSKTIPSLLSAVVSVAAIAVGFLATAKSILISADDRPIVQQIKDAGIYKRILRYFRNAIFWSFALSIVSAVGLLVNFESMTEWTWPLKVGTAVWILTAVTSIFCYQRIATIWYTLLDSLDTPSL